MKNTTDFRINVFLESTRFKAHKKFVYFFFMGICWAVQVALIGINWKQAALRSVVVGLTLFLTLASAVGKSLVSPITSRMPWSKFGYFSVKIIGCEAYFEETSPHLFLHKNSPVGQIKDWIKSQTGAPGDVDLIWAGCILKDNDKLSIGIGAGSNLIAALHQKSLDESLQTGETTKPRRIESTEPNEPDFSFDHSDDESVPSFIRDMIEDEDDEDDDAEKPSRLIIVMENTGKIKAFLEHVMQVVWAKTEVLSAEFGDSKWLGVMMEDEPRLDEQAPPIVPPANIFGEDSDESDTEEFEAPSFLREMLSDDDEDDDDEDEEDVVEESKPNFSVVLRAYITNKAEWLAGRTIRPTKSFINRRWRVWKYQMLRNIRCFKVTPEPWIKRSRARDVITLEEDENEFRYILPCRFDAHSMSQHSLLGYMKNQVLVDKNESISCPVGGCTYGKPWHFGEICEILREKNDGDFEYPAEDVFQVERELSANMMSKKMNCQRCPECEIVLAREMDSNDTYDCECFGCGTVFCWSCRAPWDADSNSCLNSKCASAWRFVSAQMLKNCPRKHIDHMANVPTLRACPECGQLITHVTACKHMCCSLCKTRFCFICVAPQKNGSWQCGYDANSCKLTEVQSVDALADGRVSRTSVLDRVPTEKFVENQRGDPEEIRRAQEEFVANVMASIQDQSYFN